MSYKVHLSLSVAIIILSLIIGNIKLSDDEVISLIQNTTIQDTVETMPTVFPKEDTRDIRVFGRDEKKVSSNKPDATKSKENQSGTATRTQNQVVNHASSNPEHSYSPEKQTETYVNLIDMHLWEKDSVETNYRNCDNWNNRYSSSLTQYRNDQGYIIYQITTGYKELSGIAYIGYCESVREQYLAQAYVEVLDAETGSLLGKISGFEKYTDLPRAFKINLSQTRLIKIVFYNCVREELGWGMPDYLLCVGNLRLK